MYKINFNMPIHIHFIGIGGISMSGLAEILLKEGFTVSGSDVNESSLTEHLISLGAVVFYGQKSSNINTAGKIDAVVYTAAISESNEEWMTARDLGIPMLKRAELLGQIMQNYSTAIAVSGTHGKTTTTSMIAQILLESEADPTISVGGILKSISGNIKVGNSDMFLTEACEYTNSFLNFYPTISLILNIEEDHMDFFKDLQDIKNSFRLFAQRLPAHGTLIINGDIENYEEITNGLKCNVITYGLNSSCTYTAENITFDTKARPQFDLIINGVKSDTIQLGVTGIHNVSNALSAIALSYLLTLNREKVKSALSSFSGTNRRFEYKGELGGITIIDDYAHHPTEICATLSTAKNYPHQTTWCIFQPHTYTRTKAFLKDFAKALSLADKIILTDIYAAREKNTLDISSVDLLKELELLSADAYYFPCFDEIENFLLGNCTQGDLIITMGAGDVYKIGESLLGQ